MGLVLFEVLDEHRHQLDRLAVVGRRVGPGAARVQQRAVDAGYRDRHLEAETRIGAKFGAVQRAVQRRRQQRPGRLDRHPRADPVGAAGPAGVDQPAGRAVPGDLVTQERAVDLGPAGHERGAEAGRKRRLRRGHALLGARHLGGEAGQVKWLEN